MDKNFKENAYILTHELGHSLEIEHDFYFNNHSGNKIYRYRYIGPSVVHYPIFIDDSWKLVATIIF